MKIIIKELFTAYYDIYTGEIKGCEKGGLAWHHEECYKIINVFLGYYGFLDDICYFKSYGG